MLETKPISKSRLNATPARVNTFEHKLTVPTRLPDYRYSQHVHAQDETKANDLAQIPLPVLVEQETNSNTNNKSDLVQTEERIVQQVLVPVPDEVKPIEVSVAQVPQTSIKKSICFDVKYDGEAVITFDQDGKIIETFHAMIYKGLPEIVRASGAKSEHICQFDENESIVMNPTNLNKLASTVHYGWFAKSATLKEHNILMNTDWHTSYITSVSIQASTITCSHLPLQAVPVPTLVVSSVKSQLYKLGMVPMLETLIHIRQGFFGMTLHQIASQIFGEANPAFTDERLLLSYLFEEFRNEFKELCRVEYTAIHKLFQCDFNITFGHHVEKENITTSIRCVKHLKDVCVVPVSGLFSDKTYANIPWTIGTSQQKEAIQRDARFISMPLVYVKTSANAIETPYSIYYYDVSIFPEAVIKGRMYSAGSSIGIVSNKDETRDIFMRGELFEDISLREQMIIMLMYDKFLMSELLPGMNYSSILRFLSFNEKDRVVRPELIEYIRNTLLTKV